MELDRPSFEFAAQPDRRSRVPEPPPVLLLAVADVSIDVPIAMVRPVVDQLVELLKFEVESHDAQQSILRAGNFRLIVRGTEGAAPREDLAPLRLVVPSLASLRAKLGEQRVEYVDQRGMIPGQRLLVFQDRAGGFVEVGESRQIA